MIEKIAPLYWPEKKSQAAALIAATLLTLTSPVVDAGLPLLLKEIVNNLNAKDEKTNKALFLSLGYVGAFLLSKVMERIHVLSVSAVSIYAQTNLTLKTVNHIHNLTYPDQAEVNSSEIQDIINQSSAELSQITYNFLLDVMPTLIGACSAARILSSEYNPLYGALLLANISIFLLYILFTNDLTKDSNQKWLSGLTTLNNKISEIISNHDFIHQASRSKYEHNKLQLLSNNENALAMRKNFVSESIISGQTLILTTGLCLISMLFIKEIQEGTYASSDLILLVGYLKQFMMPLSQIGYILKNISSSFDSLERSFELLEKKDAEKRESGANISAMFAKTLEFKNLSFGYTPENIILHNLSFQVRRGETLAILGKSGCGKSTISKLLFRFYEAPENSILIDNRDIKEWDLKFLRNSIGINPQKTSFMAGTLRENIIYMNPEASDEEIQQLATLCGLEQLISSLPNGYNSMIEQGPSIFSGGEQTRISIARTLLKKASIYLLDEPTTGLDDENKNKIISLIKSHPNKSDAITIIITHDPELASQADKVITLPDEKTKNLEHESIAEPSKKEEPLNKHKKINNYYGSFFNKKVIAASVASITAIATAYLML